MRSTPDDLAAFDGELVAVFMAHPDDEVFTTATATLAFARAGARVHLWVATGGELPELQADASLDEAGARKRRGELLTRSCALMGIDGWSYLTQPGQWLDIGKGPNTLAAAPTGDVAAAVRAVLDREGPALVLTVGADGLTGHPDHIAMHDAVAAALRLPGWEPRETLGAVVAEEDVREATELLERLSPGSTGHSPGHGGAAGVVGVPASRIARTFHCPGGEGPYRQALDIYTDGLGTSTLDQLIETGHASTLRVVSERTGWETTQFSTIT